jgi:hypothetical protein
LDTRSKKKIAGRYSVPLLFICLGASLFVGCRRTAAISGDLVLYTSLPAANVREIASAFENKVPKVKLTVVSAGSGEIQARIGKEMAAGRIRPTSSGSLTLP